MQATMVCTNSQTNNKGTSPILVMLILTLIIVGGVAISHAIKKHEQDAVTARSCIDKNGADLIYVKGIDNNRRVQLCILPDQRLAIRVMELVKGKWEEITAYIKDDSLGIEGAIDYAEVDGGPHMYISYIKECWKALVH